MDDMIVTVRFTDIGEARRALRELEQLDRDGRLRVRGAALVERSGQGRIELSEGARDDTGHILPPAGTAGMLVDVLGGPPVAPYFGLASGFLTGKYRPGGPAVDSARAGGAAGFWEAGGAAKLEALDAVAAAHGVPVAAVALAWLAAQPHVVSPIASARTVQQLQDLLPVQTLVLSADEVETLSAA